MCDPHFILQHSVPAFQPHCIQVDLIRSRTGVILEHEVLAGLEGAHPHLRWQQQRQKVLRGSGKCCAVVCRRRPYAKALQTLKGARQRQFTGHGNLWRRRRRQRRRQPLLQRPLPTKLEATRQGAAACRTADQKQQNKALTWGSTSHTFMVCIRSGSRLPPEPLPLLDLPPPSPPPGGNTYVPRTSAHQIANCLFSIRRLSW